MSISHLGMNSPSSPAGAIAGSVLPIRRAEELIATLPGVLSVRIVPNETGAIDEIHVLTTDQVAPKQTVRNIESALIAQLGWRVNHRKISIATTLDVPRALDAPPPVAAGPADLKAVSGAPAPAMPVAAAADVAVRGDRRVLVFEDVEVRRSRTRGATCRVILRRDETEYVGEAEGPETERARVDLAARATVQAVAEAVPSSRPGGRTLALDGAVVVTAFDREYVLVSVRARAGREAMVLTGTCEVHDSPETSAALAVLDATNRWTQLER